MMRWLEAHAAAAALTRIEVGAGQSEAIALYRSSATVNAARSASIDRTRCAGSWRSPWPGALDPQALLHALHDGRRRPVRALEQEVPRTLIVADEPGALRCAEETLAASCETTCATTVDEALALLERNEYELLVADVVLAERDGLELVPRARALQPWIGALVISARATKQTALRLLEVGAGDLLEKPFVPEDLQRAVERLWHVRRVDHENQRLVRTLNELNHALRDQQRHLNDSREQLELCLESGAVGAWSWSLDSAELKVDQRFARMFACGSSALTLDDLLELLQADDRARVEAAFQRCVRSGDALNEEIRVLQAGALRHYQLRASVIFDQLQRARLTGICSDVTEARTTREELRCAHAQTDMVLASISAVMIVIDEGGVVRLWNEAAATDLGRAKEEVVGRALAECALSWDWPVVEAALQRSFATEQTVRVDEVAYVRAGGAGGVLGLTLSPMHAAGGALRGVVLMGRDITLRRELETQLAQTQKLESIGQLAAGIAHEINTPTQFISDNTRFIKDSFGDLEPLLKLCEQLVSDEGAVGEDALAELVRHAREADLTFLVQEIPGALEESLGGLQRVSGIVGAMKEFSHPGSGEKEAIDLNRALESTATVSRNEWKYVAELVFDFDPELPAVACYPGEINQVFLNLLVNAAHAIDAKGSSGGVLGRIDVRTRAFEDRVEVAISDDGCGIDAENVARIFDPFCTTKEVGKGTGQGLAITRSVIVDKHGGGVDVKSTPGAGTTFTLSLPLHPTACPALGEADG